MEISPELVGVTVTAATGAGAGLLQLGRWLWKRAKAEAVDQVEDLEDHEARIRDCRERRDHWRERYYEQRSEAGSARMVANAAMKRVTELEQRVTKLSALLDQHRAKCDLCNHRLVAEAVEKCQQVCNHQLGCPVESAHP